MTLIPLGANPAHPYTVVVCGDIMQSKLLRQLQSAVANVTIVECSEDHGTLALCKRLGASVLLARQPFIAEQPGRELTQLAAHGDGAHIVAVLDSDSFDAAAQMLELGCRGLLPPRFSAKLLKHSMLSVFREESAPLPE